MSSGNSIADIFGYIGILTTVALVMAPAPTFWRIRTTRHVEEFRALPYLIALLQCTMWVAYAGISISMKPSLLQLLLMNIAGTVIELFWCTIYFVYTHEKRAFVFQFGSVVAFILFVASFCNYYIGSLNAAPILPNSTLEGDIIGMVAAVIVVAMYAAPLGIVGHVIRTRSVEYMPFSLCLMCLINSSVQTAYAVSIVDWLYIIPNSLGIMVSIAQLAVYTLYSGRSVELQSSSV